MAESRQHRDLRRYFDGVAPGDRCTGTVHFWGLCTRNLLQRRVIRLTDNEVDYVFVGLPKDER